MTVMILKKRHATLLEVLIAMALTIVILMTVMFFYREVGIIGGEIDRTKTQNFYMRYAESRLAEILPRTVAKSDTKGDYVFFSIADEGITKPGSQSLIFTFDHDASLDKVFSNHDLGRLYLDKDGRLTLAYWPSPERWDQPELPPMKKEILFENAESLAFEFFVAPAIEKEEEAPKKKNEETPKASEPEPRGQWRMQPWLKEYEELPVMVKVVLTLPNKSEKIVYIFPLVNNKTHVIY